MSSTQMPGAGDPHGQPSEEEMRAYVEQLRAADPAGIVVQAYQVLGTGAEVKLGLPDARLLIDAMSGLVGAVEGRVDAELTNQMKAGVTQLQNAQVQVEAELRRQGGGGEGTVAPSGQEPAGAGAESAGRGAGQQPSGAAQPGQEGQSVTDRLWIPGRGQTPPGGPSGPAGR